MDFSDEPSSSRLYAAKRASRSVSVRTSVSSMRSLLPFKLSSNSTTELRPAPPIPVSIKRSTFGILKTPLITRSPPTSETPSPRSVYSPRRPLEILPVGYRDIPIYTDSRLMNPSPVYYRPSSLLGGHSPSISSEEDWSVEPVTPLTEMSEDYSHGGISMKNMTEDYQRDSYDKACPQNWEDVPRNSSLSFQCRGEVHPSENKETFSSLGYEVSLNSAYRLQEAESIRPQEIIIGGWPGGTNRESSKNALSKKTNSVTQNLPLGDHTMLFQDPLNIPPRSSSLTVSGQVLLPPLLYSDKHIWNQYQQDVISSRSGMNGTQRFVSDFNPFFADQTRLESDEAVLELSVSNSTGSMMLPESAGWGLTGAGLNTCQPAVISPVLWDTMSHSAVIGLSTVEEFISASTILEYSSYISAVRSQLKLLQGAEDFSSSGLPHESRVAVQSKNSLTRRMASGLSYLAYNSSKLSAPNQNDSNRQTFGKFTASQLPANLDPLRRIFPFATDTSVLALYAQTFAYILISQLSTKSEIGPAQKNNTYVILSPTHVLPKAASMLGIPTTGPEDRHNREKRIRLEKRLGSVSKKLLQYIGRLVACMRFHLKEGNTDAIQETGDCSLDEVLLQALIEVVTSCEKP